MAQVHSLFENLKNELKTHGLTYQDVADYLGLTLSSVKRLFASEDISLQRLDKICELIGIDLEDLTRIDESESRAIEVMTPTYK